MVLALPVLADETDPANWIFVDGIGYMTYPEYHTYLSELDGRDLGYLPVEEYDGPSVLGDPPVVHEPIIDDVSAIELYDVESVISDAPVLSDYIPLDDEMQLVDVTLLTSLAPVTPSDATGLKAVLLSFLGNYDPIVAEYRYMNSNSSTYSYLREVQPDYVWLCSCALLVVMIYCLFKLGGALLCRR